MKEEMESTLFSIDDEVAKMALNIETLKNIHYEITKIRYALSCVKEDDFSKEIINYSLISMIDDLLFHTIKDLNKSQVIMTYHINNQFSP